MKKFCIEVLTEKSGARYAVWVRGNEDRDILIQKIKAAEAAASSEVHDCPPEKREILISLDPPALLQPGRNLSFYGMHQGSRCVLREVDK